VSHKWQSTASTPSVAGHLACICYQGPLLRAIYPLCVLLCHCVFKEPAFVLHNLPPLPAPAMLQPRPVRLVLTVQWQPRLCHRTSGSRAAQPCRLRIFRRLVPRAADERQCCHDEQQADGSPCSPHQTSQIATYAHPDAQRRRREHQQRCGTCPALQKARNGPTFIGGAPPYAIAVGWSGI